MNLADKVFHSLKGAKVMRHLLIGDGTIIIDLQAGAADRLEEWSCCLYAAWRVLADGKIVASTLDAIFADPYLKDASVSIANILIGLHVEKITVAGPIRDLKVSLSNDVIIETFLHTRAGASWVLEQRGKTRIAMADDDPHGIETWQSDLSSKSV